ncbi:MAG: hypothetical protein ACI4X9_05220 [Kiritimatiellia bacterium]
MKQFIIAALALMAVVTAQAAAVSWKTGAIYAPNSDGSYSSTKVTSGYIAYLFEGDSSAQAATVASILDGTFDKAAANVVAEKTVGALGISGTVGSDYGFVGGSSYNLYMVIFNADSYENAYALGADGFYMSYLLEGVAIPASGNGSATFTSQVASGSWQQISSVPEPVFMGIFASAMVAVLLRRQKNLA